MSRWTTAISLLAALAFLFLWRSERAKRFELAGQHQELTHQLRKSRQDSETKKRLSAAPSGNSGSSTNAAFLELMRLRNAVTMLRKEVEEIRTAPKSKGSLAERDPALAAALNQSRITFAEEKLARAEAQYQAGVLTANELTRTQAEVDILRAESTGNAARALQIKADLAETQLSEAERLHSLGLISAEGYTQAKLTRDVAAAEANGDPLEVARLKFQAADERLRLARLKHENGIEPAEALSRAELEKKIAEAEYISLARQNPK